MALASRKNRPDWVSRNLLTISWVSLLQDAASEMLYPVMPVFLNTVLGAPAAIVGAIEGAAEGMMATTKLLSGWLNNWIPRKRMVLLGYAGAALGKFIIALAGAWPIVLLGRMTDRLGKGIRSAPRDAILVNNVDRGDRGKVIGFHRTADTAGAVIGPAFVLALLSLFDTEIRTILWIAIIPAVASTLAVLFIRDDEPARKKNGQSAAESAATEVKDSAPLPREITRLITLLSVFALVNFPDALILLHLSQSGFGLNEVIAAYLVFNISYALLSFPFGALTDRFAPHQIYSLGLVCFAVTYGGLALTSDFAVAVILVVVYGAFSAANDTVGKAWASKLAPTGQQLRVQARLQGLSGFGILAAGLWAGALWNVGDGIGQVPLMISAVCGLLVAVVMLRQKWASVSAA
ncbi:MAG: hypothetical protein RL441_795 [Actinomycetota bacterium]